MKNPAEKRELHQAYFQRKDNLAAATESYQKLQTEDKPGDVILTKEDIGMAVMNVEGDGFSHHTFEDIGRYTVFPNAMYNRMFPKGRGYGTF